MLPPDIRRGCVFRAEHDSSFEFWRSPEPRWKLCLAFNAAPPALSDDVHYFLATSKLTFFQENPQFQSDVLVFPPDAYPFFPVETAIDFRELRVVSLAKLVEKGLAIRGHLSTADILRCEAVVRGARLLPNRARRLLGLLR